MNKTIVYLIYFCIYSAILLIIGKTSLKDNNTVHMFYIGGRKVSLSLCVLTFCGTWVSAASILGFTGGVFESGYATLLYSVIPWFVGALLLIYISDRLYAHDIITMPEFFYVRYQSKGLQLFYGLLMITVYVLYLVIQIRGFGLVASTLFGIPYGVSIFLVYLFILYATFGGFNTVAKTDAFNLVALSVGLVITFAIVLLRAGSIVEIHQKAAEITGFAHAGVSFPTEKGELLQLFGKEKYAPLMSMTMFFGWGLGLAANPQYAVRMLSAKDKRTAKMTIVYSLCYLSLLYFSLLVIGLGIRVLFPSIAAVSKTDELFVYVINNLLYTPLSGFFLFTIIGACISTANSQLLLIASSVSYDVLNIVSPKPLSEQVLLTCSRLSILAGGTLSLLFSVNPPNSLLSYGGDIWGLFGTLLFPTLYGTLLYKKATKTGVWCSIIAGCISIAIFYPPYYRAGLPYHPSFPAGVISMAAFFIVSKFSYGREKV